VNWKCSRRPSATPSTPGSRAARHGAHHPPHRDGKSAARAHINLPLAKAYATELARLAKQLKLSGEITLDQIVRAPGVFQTDEELVDAESIWPVVEKALKQALAALVKMREREGAHLAQDLAARIGVMRQCAGRVQKQAPQTAERYRQQLVERIKNAGWNRPRRMTSGC